KENQPVSYDDLTVHLILYFLDHEQKTQTFSLMHTWYQRVSSKDISLKVFKCIRLNRRQAELTLDYDPDELLNESDADDEQEDMDDFE
ncbi:MAG: hypothetical protein EZS28_006673, partial [Streblomastix strix]